MSETPATMQAGDEAGSTYDQRMPMIRSRSFLARLVLDTVGQKGAKLGLAWVAILILLAVFAPLIANSRPILWKAEINPDKVEQELYSGWIFSSGEVDAATGLQAVVSSPLLGYLTPVDWTLLVGFFGLALFFVKKIPAGKRLLGWVVLLAVTYLGAGLALNVPEVDSLQFYRDRAVAGHVDWSVKTVIPYSANDRQQGVFRATGEDPRELPPSRKHWMGTTLAGADVLSRMIHASRVALTIGLIATGISATIGIMVGGLMGYFSGRVDLFGMRCVEVFSAIPVIFLLIMIVAFYGRSLYLMTVILGLTGWVGYALFVRAEFLKIRSMDYVQAARAIGAPLWSILLRHMLPNGITPVLVLASFGIASMILTESTLSFIGLGLEDDPSWGQMLSEARSSPKQWGLVMFPGLAIFLTVLAYNLIGEALRDALDPQAAKKSRASH